MTCCPTCGQKVSKDKLLIDLAGNTVTYGDRTVKLSPQQAEMLYVLNETAPRMCTNEFMQARIYGEEDGPPTYEWINVQIFHLRRKLRNFPVIVNNHWGRGYMLVVRDEREIAA